MENAFNSPASLPTGVVKAIDLSMEGVFTGGELVVSTKPEFITGTHDADGYKFLVRLWVDLRASDYPFSLSAVMLTEYAAAPPFVIDRNHVYECAINSLSHLTQVINACLAGRYEQIPLSICPPEDVAETIDLIVTMATSVN